jgi:type I restriction enzyme S subunit
MSTTIPLSDFVVLKRGYDLPSQDRRTGTIPILGSFGVTGWHDTAKREGPGVTIGRSGASIGVATYWNGPFWPLNTALYATDFCGNDPRYVFYVLSNINFEDYNSGSAQPSLNRNYLSEIPVARIPLRAQMIISGVLGAIDDLIDNCRRRVELLEQMAKAIYREWFVCFRYPGYEATVMVDSSLGSIPEGWNIKTVGELSTNFDRLRKPLSRVDRDERPGPFPYYGAAKLIDWIDDWIFDGEYLLFAEDGTVQTPDGFPVLQLVDRKFWANNHTHILQGLDVSTRFLFLASAGHSIAGYVTGAAQPKITQANLNRIPLIVGPPAVHGAFDEVIDPIFDAWNTVQALIAPLHAIRDLLLPKLVTGQIDISKLDLDALMDSVA